MKYFNNYPYTAESLKAEFRALCLTMHPDKGGNADDFKAMSAEYYDILKNVDGTAAREAEEARQRAEEARREREEREREAREYEARERARREQEEAEERERIRKAQEVTAAAVRAWAQILERIPEAVTGKKRAYDFADDKSRAAYVAATKRNIKAVINHYFPGLKVTVSISGRIWREEFTISWQDGPSIKELRETCKELEYFIPTSYHSDPYADYGDYMERKGSAPWREAYGQALGDVTEIEYTRGLSDEGKQQAEEMAARYFANFDPMSDADTFAANLEEFGNLAKAAGFDGENLTNIFRTITGQYYADLCGYWSEITGEVNRRELRKVLAEHVRVNVTPKEKAPEFVPTYGPTYKAIKKALGANVFYIDTKDSRKNAANELNIFEAAERLARGEAVNLGKRSTWDGDPVIYGTDRGGYKTQQKRAAKFEAVGIILEGVSFNTYGNINAQGIKAETLEALRREFADIERQRKQWEQEQTAKASEKADNGKKAAKTDNTKQENRETVTTNEGNADGLTMEQYSEKATVIRGYNEQQAAELEAMGGKEWRNLRGGKGYIFSTRRHADELAAWMKRQTGEDTTAPAADEPTATASENDTTTDESEPEALRGATLQEIERKSDRTAAPAWLKPGATFKRTRSDGREVVAICTRLLLDGFAYITANGCAVVDHVAAFAGYNFDGLTPCDIDDDAPEFAHMLRNFQRIRKGFEEYQTAHPYTEQSDTATASAPADNEQADTLHEAEDITATASEAANLSPVLQAFADVLRIFADIMQQAKQWEGVTVPAATLARWKQEATEGTKTAAARLCEVCACLASLTPDSRRDFDALGAIFWSLSEQIRNGCNPDTLQAATDYARAQLFDLIDRTQTENQARAVREANSESDEQRKAA